MLNTFLQRLGISPNPEKIPSSSNPDEAKGVSVAIETVKEAMESLFKSTLEAISTIREMVSSINLPPLSAVIQRAHESLRFVIGWSTTPGSNTISSEATS